MPSEYAKKKAAKKKEAAKVKGGKKVVAKDETAKEDEAKGEATKTATNGANGAAQENGKEETYEGEKERIISTAGSLCLCLPCHVQQKEGEKRN